MLAGGLAARGVTVSVYGPAAAWTAAGPSPAAGRSGVSAETRADGAVDVSAETRAGALPGGPAEARAGAAGDVPAETRAGARPDARGGARAGALQDGPAEARAGAAGDVPAEAPGHPGPPRFAVVEIADRPRPSRDLAAVRRLRALLAGSRPDVVHAHGLRAGALAALAIGGSAGPGRRSVGRDRADGHRARPALLVTVHNAPPGTGPAAAVYRMLERLVARRADAVLCVSGDLEARMRRLGARGVARALVPAPPAPPGVSAETRAGLGLAGGQASAPVILTVARLAPQKGLGTLIEAAAGWQDRDPTPLLLIAGTGPLRDDLVRRAQAARACVRFLGQRGDVPALLAAADVVVLPSLWEGQPLIVQETLRAGRPLVASRAGGIPDLTGEDAALLIPPGDAAALSAAVLSVLDDPARAKRLGEAAIQRSRSLPSEREALDAALAAYRRIIPGGAGGRPGGTRG
jgi:glycosyltransferase involved in cell wall biosynthesis